MSSSLTALSVSIALGGIAQVALKRAVSGRFGAETPGLGWWVRLFGSGWLWLYATCFMAATALWLLALSGLNISYAFPLLSASYGFVAVLARWWLKERVSPLRWMSIGVICLGVILIARS